MDDYDSHKVKVEQRVVAESPTKSKESIEFSTIVDLAMNDQNLAAMEFRIRYLGSGVLSKTGGTDDEIARVIHDIHDLYGQEKASIKKACEVVVYIDTQRINVYNKNDDETLLSFPLTQVHDVTTCLDRPPYSKTCVLVAKENNEPVYKAYVFYCNTAKKAAQFHQVASLAFQLGFELFKKYSSHFTESQSCDDLVDAHWNGSMEITTKDTNNECEIKQIKSRSCEKDGRHGIYKDILCKNTAEMLSPSTNSNGVMGRTVTVQLKNKMSTTTTKSEKGYMKIDLALGERDNDNITKSKLSVYVENIEERSRFLLSHWFRSSYRKFRRISNQQSAAQSVEEVHHAL